VSDLPTRGELASRCERLLDPGGPWKASVGIYTTPSGRVVVKDLAPMWPPLKLTYGRLMQAREIGVLRAIEGFSGAPRLLGVIDHDAFAEQLIEGEHFNRAMDPARHETIFRNLEQAIADLHARGVVHLDLREKKNILITPQGDAVILDFESALRCGHGFLGRLALRWLSALDRSAMLKFKSKIAPDLLTVVEKERLRRYERVTRLWFLKDLVSFLKRLVFGDPRARREQQEEQSPREPKQGNTQHL
jgi:predicted Ser/Thr protein kinase